MNPEQRPVVLIVIMAVLGGALATFVLARANPHFASDLSHWLMLFVAIAIALSLPFSYLRMRAETGLLADRARWELVTNVSVVAIIGATALSQLAAIRHPVLDAVRIVSLATVVTGWITQWRLSRQIEQTAAHDDT
jgi:hypothetical protein